jgi:hypothetical protein
MIAMGNSPPARRGRLFQPQKIRCKRSAAKDRPAPARPIPLPHHSAAGGWNKREPASARCFLIDLVFSGGK